MKKEKMNSTVELFICNHQRDDKESCAEKGAKELTDKLRKWVKEEHKGEIKIFRSGCLGRCSEGIVMACYPQQTFFTEATPEDSKEIKKGLKETLQSIKN